LTLQGTDLASTEEKPVTREDLSLQPMFTVPRGGRVVGPSWSPHRPADDDLWPLHVEYAATRDPSLRAELAVAYDGVARGIARSFPPRREPLDDLVQVARLGLLQAIDRFDPAFELPFRAFARSTIAGELKRHLRDRTWRVHVPRSLQEDHLAVIRAVDELTGTNGRTPVVRDIAAYLGISDDRVIEAMDVGMSQRAMSLDHPVAPDSDITIDIGAEDRGFERVDRHDLLQRLLARLPQRERQVVQLHFFDGLTQDEIAGRLGVSQMCISRTLNRTLGRMRILARGEYE
jgi:RNA polymerase sigma-B factor